MRKVFTFEKLYKAYLDCRKLKRKTMNALEFEWNLERNLFNLKKELEERTYSPGRSICFAVKEPCLREIFAASFRDRIVHHALINEIHDAGERILIFDTFSCRERKGTHLAVSRLRKFARQITKNRKKKTYFAQLDISGFFMSIDHDILFSVLKNFLKKQDKTEKWKEEVLWLAKKIIFHKPTKNYIAKGNSCLLKRIPKRKSLFGAPEKKGLPIGNYSSQFFSNLYLNKLDQFVKRELKCRYYVRYVDDFVLLSQDKEQLKEWRDRINLFLKTNLSLELNEKKTKIQFLESGISFLGYFITPRHMLVKKTVVGRLKKELYNKEKNKINKEKFLPFVNSYYGHFKHADSFNLRKSVFENLSGFFKTDKDYSSLKAK